MRWMPAGTGTPQDWKPQWKKGMDSLPEREREATSVVETLTKEGSETHQTAIHWLSLPERKARWRVKQEPAGGRAGSWKRGWPPGLLEPI